MGLINRLYNFMVGTRANPDEVDAEFDNIILGHNDTHNTLTTHIGKVVDSASIDTTKDKHVSNKDLNDINVSLSNKTDKTGDHQGTWKGLNPSDFSAGQQAVDIANLQNDVTAHTTNTTIHVTADDKTTWNGKYTKPAAGVPKADLQTDVQSSLNKADTAIQDIPIATNVVAGIVALDSSTNSTSTTKAATPSAVKAVNDSKIANTEKGVANGVATLGSDGKVPSSQMPSGGQKILTTVGNGAGMTTLVIPLAAIPSGYKEYKLLGRLKSSSSDYIYLRLNNIVSNFYRVVSGSNVTTTSIGSEVILDVFYPDDSFIELIIRPTGNRLTGILKVWKYNAGNFLVTERFFDVINATGLSEIRLYTISGTFDNTDLILYGV